MGVFDAICVTVVFCVEFITWTLLLLYWKLVCNIFAENTFGETTVVVGVDAAFVCGT